MKKYRVNAKTNSKKFIEVDAKDSKDAKRIACKIWDLIPNCKWTGIENLTAKKMKDVD